MSAKFLQVYHSQAARCVCQPATKMWHFEDDPAAVWSLNLIFTYEVWPGLVWSGSDH